MFDLSVQQVLFLSHMMLGMDIFQEMGMVVVKMCFCLSSNQSITL